VISLANEEEVKKKPNKLKVIIIVLIAIIIIGGVAMGLMLSGISVSDLLANFQSEEVHAVELENFVVNLNGGTRSGSYLRTTMDIVVNESDHIELVEMKKSQIRDVIIKQLMSYSPDQIQGMESIESIQIQLIEQLNRIFEEPVIKEIFFTDFLIQ